MLLNILLRSGGLSADIIDVNFNMLKKEGMKSDMLNIRHIVGNCEKLPIKKYLSMTESQFHLD